MVRVASSAFSAIAQKVVHVLNTVVGSSTKGSLASFPMQEFVECILEQLGQHQCTLSHFFFTICAAPGLQSRQDIADFLGDVEHFLEALRHHSSTTEAVTKWAERTMQFQYAHEIVHLASAASGLHFNALHATHEQLESFRVANLAQSMKSKAPFTWRLLVSLLDSDTELQARREKRWDTQIHHRDEHGLREEGAAGDINSDGFAAAENLGSWFTDADEEDGAASVAKAREKHSRLIQIVRCPHPNRTGV